MMNSVLLIILGLAIGSFLNVCIYRLPQKQSIVKPRSRCTKCGHKLKYWENIPVLSYIILRGKCSACGEIFSIRYALVEILTAAIYFTIYWRFGYTWETVLYILFFTIIIVLSFIDIDYQIIPNELLLISLAPVITLLLFQGLDGIWNNLIGAFILVGVFLLIGYLGKIAYKQDSMGMGDVKYAFVIGLLLGWKVGLLAVMLSFFAAAIMVLIMKFTSGVESRQRIPFGPFLSIGLFVSAIWGNQIIEWYIGLLS